MKTKKEKWIHMETEIFLRKEQQKLEKLEFWVEKSDKDPDMKKDGPNTLKTAKASVFEHFQTLQKC